MSFIQSNWIMCSKEALDGIAVYYSHFLKNIHKPAWAIYLHNWHTFYPTAIISGNIFLL